MRLLNVKQTFVPTFFNSFQTKSPAGLYILCQKNEDFLSEGRCVSIDNTIRCKIFYAITTENPDVCSFKPNLLRIEKTKV